MHHMKSTNVVVVLVSLFLSSTALASDENAKPIMILDSLKTSFRYFEVMATDVVKTKEGKLVRVDFTYPTVVNDKKERILQEAKRITHTPLPGSNWMKPGFDDSQWVRVGPAGRWWKPKIKDGIHYDYTTWGMMQIYRSLAMMCVRSGFEVVDPDKVGDLTLHLQLRGGVVVYLNGQEVGRAHMPEGEVKWDTVAEEYPQKAFVNKDGKLIANCVPVRTKMYAPPYINWRTAKFGSVLAPRMRIVEISIPANKLKKGRSVLALGLHRAPALEDMFTVVGHGSRTRWNRVSLESLKLRASGEAAASVLPNTSAPARMTVASLPICNLKPGVIADASESTGPVKVQGVANGAFAGMVLVNCASPLENFRVIVSDLKDKGSTIAAQNINIGYQKLDVHNSSYAFGIKGSYFKTIDSEPPALVEKLKVIGHKNKVYNLPHASQPIWFVVNIPKDTPAGLYKGEVTVSAKDQDDVKFPILVEVLGSWQLPKSTDFRTFVVFISSPETLALYYDVPLWSEEHWKLCEESLRLLGQLGNKEAIVTFTPKTFVGNEHAMLRFIKGKDGKLKADFSIVDRYIGLAAKHMGKIPSICTIFNYGAGPRYAGEDKGKQYITIYDPETKTLTDSKDIPQWRTPEALAFWKPVTDEYLAILKKHKVAPYPTMYWTQFCGVNWGAWDDLKKLMPGLMHANNRTHIGSERGRRKYGKHRLYCGVVAHNGPGVYWDPEFDKPSYGWRHKVNILSIAREGLMGKNSPRYSNYLSQFRMIPELTLLTGKGKGRIRRAGFGQYGADFWGIMHKVQKVKGVHNRYGVRNLTGRYCPEGGAGLCGIGAILGPGEKQPCPIGNFQMMREGLQEAEARMYVIDAILDQPDKLGADLLKRAKEITDNHTHLLRFFTITHYFGERAPQVFQQKAREMYLLASEVQKALGK